MNQRIRNLLLGAFVTVAVALQAQDNKKVPALVIEQTDGTQTTFILPDKPVISIADNELTARSSKQEVTVPLSELADYHFIEVSSGVREVNADNNIGFADGKAILSNLRNGDRVDIYTLDGRLLDSIAAGDDGVAEVEFGRYDRGILIIRSPRGSFKVNNR